MRVLRDAGVVDTEPCGRFTYYSLYSLRPEAIEALAGVFAELAASTRAAAGTRRACP